MSWSHLSYTALEGVHCYGSGPSSRMLLQGVQEIVLEAQGKLTATIVRTAARGRCGGLRHWRSRDSSDQWSTQEERLRALSFRVQGSQVGNGGIVCVYANWRLLLFQGLLIAHLGSRALLGEGCDPTPFSFLQFTQALHTATVTIGALYSSGVLGQKHGWAPPAYTTDPTYKKFKLFLFLDCPTKPLVKN